jgi:hypothetical protein
MQDLMCYMGQQNVFEEASATMHKLRGLSVPAKQIERVCHYFGEELTVTLPTRSTETTSPAEHQWEALAAKTEPHYVMMDGTMIFTREEHWKEVKLGRIFSARNNVSTSKNRGIILKSEYVAHLGGHEAFLRQMEYYTDAIKEKIFVADGAKWIWSWVDTYYPESVQILDFYHAKEHLCDYAKLRFGDTKQMECWVNQQSTLLLDDGVDEVITHLRTIPIRRNAEEKSAREKLITYYQSNRKRMMYKTFQEAGYAIGSGAMESAHRTVIQKRLKLSGQRWTKRGAQQILNLRVAKESNQWNKIVALTKNAA